MILGVCGSPRAQATEHVLHEALKMLSEKATKPNFGLSEEKTLRMSTLRFLPKKQAMRNQDDMQELLALMKQANGIIFATPSYNGMLSAQTKIVMDRTRAAVAADKDFFLGKIIMGIALGGDRAGGQEMALTQIHTFAILNGAIPVSGGFFGANLGATFWTKDSVDGVKRDEEGFRSLKKTIKRFMVFIERYGEKTDVKPS
jgi:multimeric flavodoxin WrbA